MLKQVNANLEKLGFEDLEKPNFGRVFEIRINFFRINKNGLWINGLFLFARKLWYNMRRKKD